MSQKYLGRRGKELVASLIKNFELERDNGGPLIPLNAVRERVAAALSISVSTVSSVSTAVKNNEVLRLPKKRSRSKPITNLQSFNENTIRNNIYRMYENHEHITVKILWEKLTNDELFEGCPRSLHTVLKNIGFVWKKDNPRRGLMELPDVALKRVRFLRSYMQIQQEAMYQFVYLDETWLFQNGTVGRSWQNDDLRTVKTTKVDGKRYIILHAGNANGFVNGAELVFSSSTKNEDYHGEMNEKNFIYWFENQLLKNLEEPSVIVMDNASYHSTTVTKIPNSSWKKDAIRKWFTDQNVAFESTLLKTELLGKVSANKPAKVYVADQLAEKYGHKVLRLPPYHCMFNPIELIWGISKNYYNKHLGRDGKGIESCKNMWRESLATVTPKVWTESIEHTEAIIKKYWDQEVKFDLADLAPLIINIGSDDDDDSDADEY